MVATILQPTVNGQPDFTTIATFVHYHQRTLPSGRIKIIAYMSVSRVNVVRTKPQRALVTDRSHVLNVRLLVEKIFKNDNLGAIALTGKSAHDIEFPSLNVDDEEIHRLKIGSVGRQNDIERSDLNADRL